MLWWTRWTERGAPTPAEETDGRVQAGVIVYPPRGSFGPRIQRDYQLVMLHSGSMTVEIDGQPRTLEPGQVALLKPGHREYFRFARDTPSRHSWLALHQPRLSPAQMAALDDAPFRIPLSRPMSLVLDAALAVRRDPDLPASPVLTGLVTAALALYTEEARRQGTASERAREHPAVSAVRELVRLRLAEPIRLREMAEAAHVAPEHLVRLFQRDLGTTPMRYLWAERVREGAYLLEHTGLSVGEIADRTGFRTSNHFSRLIRASTGRSPSQLRRSSWTAADEGARDQAWLGGGDPPA